MSIPTSLIGQTIVTEECYENDDNGAIINRHHFLTTTEGNIWHLMIVDEFDQYDSFKLITEKEKEKVITDWSLAKVGKWFGLYTIVKEECYENDDNGEINRDHFLYTTKGEILHLMIVDGYDQYDSFKLITEKEKEKVIADWSLNIVASN